MSQLSEHFTTEEFACQCGCGYGMLAEHISKEIITKLERIRRMVDEPVIITSGCRCIIHNQAVGGVSNSAHLRGTAADIKLSEWNGLTRYKLLIAVSISQVYGIGVGKGFIHVDMDTVLQRPSAWSY